MSTIPALDPCTDILDSDLLLITHTNGNSEKMTGAEFNKRGQVIISENKTLTGTPLKTGNVVRVLFTADQSAANSSAAMVINYNTADITVKVCKNGALENYIPFTVSSGVYKYCQAYTAMELVYDGTYFIILGNPVVFSDANTTIFADGSKEEVKSVRTITPTIETAFGTSYCTVYGKIVQLIMNGAYNVNIAPGDLILSGLPKAKNNAFFPVYEYRTQTLIGLLQITTDGKLYSYSGNRQNITAGVYSIVYIAE